MLRILVLCYEYPPLGGGGGRVAAQVAAALVERGHQVRFVTAGMPHLPRRSMIDGVEVIRVRAKRQREDTCSVVEMMLWMMAALPVALREAWSWKPTIMHVHFAVPTGVLAWMVHQLLRIPYVLTAHLGDVPGGVPEQTEHLFKIIKPFTIPIWRAAAQLTAVSSFVASLAHQAYGLMPRVIPNGIRLPHQLVEKTSGCPRLLMVGRMSIQKNHLFAIEALALLRALPWTLHMIGEGPLFGEVQDQVRHLGLEDRITFSGWLAAPDVQAAMEQADILLMPSLSEGLPMVGVEALAYGLAIVGSRIGGLQDIISENQNGVFFDLADGPEAMARALRPLLENQTLLQGMQKASSQQAVAFEWSRSIDAYEETLQAASALTARSADVQKHG